MQVDLASTRDRLERLSTELKEGAPNPSSLFRGEVDLFPRSELGSDIDSGGGDSLGVMVVLLDCFLFHGTGRVGHGDDGTNQEGEEGETMSDRGKKQGRGRPVYGEMEEVGISTILVNGKARGSIWQVTTEDMMRASGILTRQF